MKQGKGSIIHGNTTANTHGNETYEGDWDQDLMQGDGVYHFTSGAVYNGQWISGRRHGHGLMQYPDGSSYDGQWEKDEMHGIGKYIDSKELIWEGLFVNNTYQSQTQKKLQSEKKFELKITAFEDSAVEYFTKFFEAFSISDKKTMKENMAPFFIKPEELANYVKEPYTKYEEKPADQWKDAFHKLIDEGGYYRCAIKSAEDSAILEPERILAAQLSDTTGGQIVEFSKLVDNKTIWVVLCQLSEGNWTIVHYTEKADG